MSIFLSIGCIWNSKINSLSYSNYMEPNSSVNVSQELNEPLQTNDFASVAFPGIKAAQEISKQITASGMMKSLNKNINQSAKLSNLYESIGTSVLKKWVFSDSILGTTEIMANAMNNILSSKLSAFSALSNLANNLQSSFAVPLKDFSNTIFDFSHILDSFKIHTSLFDNLIGNVYPTNILAATKKVEFKLIIEVEYDDGIALFDVLRPSLVRRLMNADTTAKRRSILSHGYMQILGDCRSSIDKAANNTFYKKSKAEIWYTHLLSEAIAVLAEGRLAAGQSLLADVLSSLLAEQLDFSYRDYMNFRDGSKKSDPQKLIKEQNIRTILAFLPVYSAWQHFNGNSDSVPIEFSRHAIAHRPTRRQFSKTNAAQGLLCVTSLMDYCFRWDLRKR